MVGTFHDKIPFSCTINASLNSWYRSYLGIDETLISKNSVPQLRRYSPLSLSSVHFLIFFFCHHADFSTVEYAPRSVIGLLALKVLSQNHRNFSI